MTLELQNRIEVVRAAISKHLSKAEADKILCSIEMDVLWEEYTACSEDKRIEFFKNNFVRTSRDNLTLQFFHEAVYFLLTGLALRNVINSRTNPILLTEDNMAFDENNLTLDKYSFSLDFSGLTVLKSTVVGKIRYDILSMLLKEPNAYHPSYYNILLRAMIKLKEDCDAYTQEKDAYLPLLFNIWKNASTPTGYLNAKKAITMLYKFYHDNRITVHITLGTYTNHDNHRMVDFTLGAYMKTCKVPKNDMVFMDTEEKVVAWVDAWDKE